MPKHRRDVWQNVTALSEIRGAFLLCVSNSGFEQLLQWMSRCQFDRGLFLKLRYFTAHPASFWGAQCPLCGTLHHESW